MEARVLGGILTRQGVASAEALEPLFALQREKGRPLLELLVESKVASEREVARALASELRLNFLEQIPLDQVSTDVATKLPISYSRSHRLLAMNEGPDHVEIVCANPLDTDGHGKQDGIHYH